MNEPIIAFCTTCKGRRQHIEQTLPRNLADNSDYPHAKFILLDYNSQDGLVDYVRNNLGKAVHKGRLVVYSYPQADRFRMAHAKNIAHRAGIIEGADVLVSLDGDNFTGAGFASYIAEQFKANPQTFLWARMVKGLMPRGISGRLVFTPEAFVKAGGYDERFETWAKDDKDLNERLRRLGYPSAEIPAQFLDGVRHSDKMRFREYPHVKHKAAQEYDGDIESDPCADTTISNFGRFGLGIVYRNFNYDDPLELKPVPTRIFGIGMHKTGTTSLHHAFKILGFDSAHWKTAHWAKAIWLEMNMDGRSETLERSYALCDLPIPLLYRQLDKAYPGSKFILTVRDEAGWLASVRDHWNPEINKFRISWDTDPFTHRIHKELYGRKTFDADIFLARYRRHNAEVKEYFKGRDDLLIMEMDQGAGWPELCGFLGEPIPNVSYPRAYTEY